MPINGTVGTVLSDMEGKKKPQSAIVSALSNVAEEAKKSDPKDTKKKK